MTFASCVAPEGALTLAVIWFRSVPRKREQCFEFVHLRTCLSPISLTPHLESQLALAANIGGGQRIALVLHVLPLDIRSGSGGLDRERTALHMVVRELEIHNIEARLGGSVGNLKDALSHVLALDVRLARTFQGQPKTAEAGLLRVHKKLIGHLCFRLLQGATGNLDFGRIPNLSFQHIDHERTARDVLLASTHIDKVLATFPWRERDAQIAIGQLLYDARLFRTARRDNHRQQIPNVLLCDFQRHLTGVP